MHLRLATTEDAAAIASIYNQGIEDRIATFETRLRTPQEIEQWFDGVHPIVVLETDEHQVMAFASTSVYRPRPCYAGIAEFSVYVEREWRGRGAGRQVLEGLLQEVEKSGYWKLVSPRGEEIVPSPIFVFFLRSILLRPFGRTLVSVGGVNAFRRLSDDRSAQERAVQRHMRIIEALILFR
jgi:L-amino acid N-acyltransferase YncA